MNNRDKERIIVIDNFLKHPNLARLMGLRQKYYTKDNHPNPYSINKFPGIRANDLSVINPKFNNQLTTRLQCAINGSQGISGKINQDNEECKLNYSLTFEDTKYYYHYDTDYGLGQTNYAGIIYLNKNVPKGYGTTLVFSEETINIQNVYNRLVIYPTSVFHSLSGSFGNNRFNGRMVISIFFNLLP
jgi:hypothetical protein